MVYLEQVALFHQTVVRPDVERPAILAGYDLGAATVRVERSEATASYKMMDHGVVEVFVVVPEHSVATFGQSGTKLNEVERLIDTIRYLKDVPRPCGYVGHVHTEQVEICFDVVNPVIHSASVL